MSYRYRRGAGKIAAAVLFLAALAALTMVACVHSASRTGACKDAGGQWVHTSGWQGFCVGPDGRIFTP